MVQRVLRLGCPADAGGRLRCARAGDLPRLAAAARRSASPGIRTRLPHRKRGSPRSVSASKSVAKRRLAHMISSVRGTVLALGDRPVVVEVGGVGLASPSRPQHALRAARRRRGHAAHRAHRPRGRPVAVRLRRRRGAARSSTCCAASPGVGPKSAMGVLAAHGARRRSPQPSPRRTTRRSARCPASGRRPRSSSSCRSPARCRRLAHRAPARSRSSTACGDSVLAALVGLGWSERVAAQAVETMPRPPPADGQPPSAACAAAPRRCGPGQLAASDARDRGGSTTDRRSCGRRPSREAELAFEGALRPQVARRVRRSGEGARPAAAAARRRAACRTAPPTTSCSPARPGSARRRSR